MNQYVEEFKEFILRGNVVDLAVGIVIGVAFSSVVNALVSDLITPVIAAIGGEPSFSSLDFTVNDSRFLYGHFLETLLAFLIIAAVVFFLVVKPINMLMDRMKVERPIEETTRECPQCLSAIPRAARRCAFCTSEIGAA
jgi:large conductance mechanosensitive channel